MARKRSQRNSSPASRPLAAIVGATLVWSSLAHGQALDGDQILQRTRAVYSMLGSYADRASIVTEFQYPGSPLLRERYDFTTVYRAPRDFLLIFDAVLEGGGERYVLRSDENAVYTWWSATGIEETYPPGTGLSAFGVSAYPTKSAVLQVLPLIFSDFGLSGPITDVATATLDGEEEIEGHVCYRLRGVGRSAYGTGGGETFRPTTLWIDKETFLVRRVFQDTQQGSTTGTLDRQTTSFEPRANPALEDDAFAFKPPQPRS